MVDITHLTTASNSLSLIHPTKSNYLILSRITHLTPFLNEVGYYVKDDFISESARTSSLVQSFFNVYHPSLVFLVSKFKKFVKDEQSIVHLELKHAVNALATRLKEEDEAPEALMREVLDLVKPIVDKAEEIIMEWRNKLRPKVKEMVSELASTNFKSMHSWDELMVKAKELQKNNKAEMKEFWESLERALVVQVNLQDMDRCRNSAAESMDLIMKDYDAMAAALKIFTATLVKLRSEIQGHAARTGLTSHLPFVTTAFSELTPLLPPSLPLSPSFASRTKRAGTLDYRHYGYWYPARPSLSQRVAFETATPAEDIDVIYGLSRFDLDCFSTSYGVQTQISNIGKDGFDAQIKATAGTTLFGASLSWLELPRSDKRFRRGSITYKPGSEGWAAPENNVRYKIVEFAPFGETPVVCAWLQGFDISPPKEEQEFLCSVWAMETNPGNFKLQINLDHGLKEVTVCWLAYESGIPRVWGCLSGITPRENGEGDTLKKSWILGKEFKGTPQAFVALTGFEGVAIKQNLRLTSDVEVIGNKACTTLATWGVPKMKRAWSQQLFFEF